jgi:hypothetical protein
MQMQQVLTAHAAQPQSKNSRLSAWWSFWTHSGQPSAWPEWAALALCAALIAIAIPYHEPWADEAQAWQLARSLSLPSLFHTYVRYEGSPGLWHFLLWILVRLHVSYSGLHWICGAIAVFASGLLLFKSPFPRYLRLSLPFTYFLLFEYAVVARSYVLVPLLLYLIAIFWKKHPLLIAILLGLLANVALHASVISGGLAVVYYIEQIRSGRLKNHDARRKILFSAIVVVGFYVFAIWTAWPPGDCSYCSSLYKGRHSLLYATMSLVGICQPWQLSIPFWVAIVAYMRAKGCLIYLVPILFFAAFSGLVYLAFWHMGLMVPLVLCLLWITWRSDECKKSLRTGAIAYASLAFLAAIQIFWAGYALRYDHYHAYSPDLSTARILRPFVRDGAKIAVTYVNIPNDPTLQDFDAVGILPYFKQNIYQNQAKPFWWWSTQNTTEALFEKTLSTRPRVVLVQMRQSYAGQEPNLRQPRIDELIKAGYKLTNVVCGAWPVQLRVAPGTCHLIFRSPQKPYTQGTH